MSRRSTIPPPAALFCTTLIVPDAAAATVVTQQGDASIAHDAAAGRAAQPEGAERGLSAGLPAVVRHRPRRRAAARGAGSAAVFSQPHGRRARVVLPQRLVYR